MIKPCTQWIKRNMIGHYSEELGRPLTEAEVRVQRCLEQLPIPEWFRKYSKPANILKNTTPMEYRTSTWRNMKSKKKSPKNSPKKKEPSEIHRSTDINLNETYSIDSQKKSSRKNIANVSGFSTDSLSSSSSSESSSVANTSTEDDEVNTTIKSPARRSQAKANQSHTYPRVTPSRKIENINIVFSKPFPPEQHYPQPLLDDDDLEAAFTDSSCSSSSPSPSSPSSCGGTTSPSSSGTTSPSSFATGESTASSSPAPHDVKAASSPRQPRTTIYSTTKNITVNSEDLCGSDASTLDDVSSIQPYVSESSFFSTDGLSKDVTIPIDSLYYEDACDQSHSYCHQSQQHRYDDDDEYEYDQCHDHHHHHHQEQQHQMYRGVVVPARCSPSPNTRFFNSHKKSTTLEMIVQSKRTDAGSRSLIQDIIEELEGSILEGRNINTGLPIEGADSQRSFVKSMVSALEHTFDYGSDYDLDADDDLYGYAACLEAGEDSSDSELAKSTSISVRSYGSSGDEPSATLLPQIANSTGSASEQDDEEEVVEEEEEDVYWIPSKIIQLPRTSSRISSAASQISGVTDSGNADSSPGLSPIMMDLKAEDLAAQIQRSWGLTYRKPEKPVVQLQQQQQHQQQHHHHHHHHPQQQQQQQLLLQQQQQQQQRPRLFSINETAIVDSGYSDRSSSGANSFSRNATLSSPDYETAS